MSKAAIYARVSSTRQREEQTIVSQRAALREFAAAEGLEIPEDWVFEDDGYSGATLMRPALERLRDLAAQIDMPIVLCHSPDRLARKYAYQVLLLEEFGRVGTEVRFLKGGKGDSAEAELLLQFQGMIAEYEKAQIAERTRRGRLHRARQGSASVLSCAPYGYRYVAKRDGVEARFEVVEHEASVVREIFRRYVKESIALGQLARELSALGIPTATGKQCWSASALGYIVRNPVYCGRAAYGKKGAVTEPARSNRRTRLRGRRSSRAAYRRRPREQWIEIPVPAIVSAELFEQAARRSKENERFARRRTLTPSLLQGLVVCEGCGYRMYRSGGRPNTWAGSLSLPEQQEPGALLHQPVGSTVRARGRRLEADHGAGVRPLSRAQRTRAPRARAAALAAVYRTPCRARTGASSHPEGDGAAHAGISRRALGPRRAAPAPSSSAADRGSAAHSTGRLGCPATRP